MDKEKLNLTDIEKIPLETEEFVKNFGKTLDRRAARGRRKFRLRRRNRAFAKI